MATRASARALGWITFAAIMLFMAGCFTAINGIVALSNARFYVAGAVYIIADLQTWGWILLGLGIVEVFAGGAVLLGREWSRWLGISIAAINTLGHMLFLSAYPWWSLLAIALNILVIFALAAYGTAIQAFD